MAIIVKTKSKKQEKAVTDFLNEKGIKFQNIFEENAAISKTTPKKSFTAKEKEILKDIEQAVGFQNNTRK
ncbi:MAG: hypothetical protein WDO19_01015 [Bacteroidota bacterium]